MTVRLYAHAHVAAIRTMALARHPEVQAHFYPGAGHGFNCDERGSYNPEASKLARQRTLEFLKNHVG